MEANCRQPMEFFNEQLKVSGPGYRSTTRAYAVTMCLRDAISIYEPPVDYRSHTPRTAGVKEAILNLVRIGGKICAEGMGRPCPGHIFQVELREKLHQHPAWITNRGWTSQDIAFSDKTYHPVPHAGNGRYTAFLGGYKA